MQVALAEQFQNRGVVGVDLSGNPTVGEWRTWEPALARARQVRPVHARASRQNSYINNVLSRPAIGAAPVDALLCGNRPERGHLHRLIVESSDMMRI